MIHGSFTTEKVSEENQDPLPPLPSPPPPRRRGSRRRFVKVLLLACVLAALVFAVFVAYRNNLIRFQHLTRQGAETSSTGQTEQRAVNPYAEAVLLAEQNRGEPMGRQAVVDIPTELRHYRDRKRFLAVQIAEARDESVPIPHDFPALASLVRRDEQLVELPQLGRGFLLYGVGYEADSDLTHYDSRRGKSVPLFANDEEFDREQSHLAESRQQLDALIKGLKRELGKVGKKDTEMRPALEASIAVSETALESVNDRRELLDSFYGAKKSHQPLFSEYEALQHVANNLGGQTYELNQPDSRRQLKVRLLNFVRAPAREVIEELGLAYQNKFNRLLPLTSLIRPEEYQRRLRESGNSNAGAFDLPPHATGLAFDIYYGFMSAEEQQFVMDEIARLERDGRVEALRELRNHYHVFVFPDRRAPDEESIRNVASGKPDTKKREVAEKQTPKATEKDKTAKTAARTKAKTTPKTEAKNKKATRARKSAR
jgi:hypothetical protein